MKAIQIFAIIIIILMSIISHSYAIISSDLTVKELYSDPSGDSKIVFQIPIDVKLLDVSEDANWYKVAIKFYIGPVEIKNTGWAYIPVGNIIAQREIEKNKVAIVVK